MDVPDKFDTRLFKKLNSKIDSDLEFQVKISEKLSNDLQDLNLILKTFHDQKEELMLKNSSLNELEENLKSSRTELFEKYMKIVHKEKLLQILLCSKDFDDNLSSKLAELSSFVALMGVVFTEISDTHVCGFVINRKSSEKRQFRVSTEDGIERAGSELWNVLASAYNI